MLLAPHLEFISAGLESLRLNLRKETLSKVQFFIEKQLHRRYSGFRVRDEWFELSDEEAIKFPETCKEIEEMIDIMKDNPFFPKKVK